MNDAEDILRRLVEWADRPGKKPLDDFIGEAIAYLSRPKPVMAEGEVILRHSRDHSGSVWSIKSDRDEYEEIRDYRLTARIPVPAHLIEPPTVTGEVVEE